MTESGFVIVMKQPGDQLHPGYRGLDRLPPWTLDIAESLDLDELGRLEDESGLLRSKADAEQALQAYSRVWPREHLEVLWVDTAHGSPPAEIDRVEELGYDIATAAPFYSIVHELPATPYDVAAFAERLNHNRLFSVHHDAEAYMLAYVGAFSRHEALEDPDGQRIWRVFLTTP